MRAWLPPTGWERRYRRFYHRTIQEVRAEFLRRLGRIARLQTLSRLEAPDYDPINVDPELEQDSTDVTAAIAGLAAWWNLQLPQVRQTISGYYNAVNLYNDKEFIAVVKSIAGVTLPPVRTAPFSSSTLATPTTQLIARLGDTADVFRQEPYLEGVKTNWIDGQTEYINKSATEAITNGGLSLRNALVTSATAAATLGVINKVFENTDKRGQRASDDAINSLYTQLTQKRQMSLGANEYIWKTRRDERVRGNPTGLYPDAQPSHYSREGKVFNWKNPPEGGHPGEAIGCRCVAIFRLPR